MASITLIELLSDLALRSLSENGRCWSGYEPVAGKLPYEKGSCKKISEESSALPIVKKSLGFVATSSVTSY